MRYRIELLNPFGAPKSFPIPISGIFVPQKGFPVAKGVMPPSHPTVGVAGFGPKSPWTILSSREELPVI